jgi:acyl carrier protein
MQNSDPLLCLLTDFFNLPADTSPARITQISVETWDSLATVQLIADLEGTFEVEFDLDEIERLRSYDEIRKTLIRKGVSVGQAVRGSATSGRRASDDNWCAGNQS